MPFFDGTFQIVEQIARRYGIANYGNSCTTATFYRRLCQRIPLEAKAMEDLVIEVMWDTYALLSDRIGDDNLWLNATHGGRGVLQLVTDLSPERANASFVLDEDWEVTLERIIAECKPQNDKSHKCKWYNQFNVASGLTPDDNRTAIDLIRHEELPESVIDLIELKAWNSNSSPFGAAHELFRYFCTFLILGAQHRDRHFPNGRWPEFNRTRLLVLAPSQWYEIYRRFGDPDAFFELFSRAFSRFLQRLNVPEIGQFVWPGLRLDEGITRENIINFFRGGDRENLNFGYGNLTEESRAALAGWVNRAFHHID